MDKKKIKEMRMYFFHYDDCDGGDVGDDNSGIIMHDKNR